ncbi:DUF3141 domain-containing protein [Thiopseudomonas alkaliphila]|uniref:DUF3141 domain-containing protein n=1 Tax=Thiopseudomonas alkaliphila TaxID=1697053 RepID=UPI0007DC0743|nr:DUF3141 domain-containing protein [Thiopseudomonas alkaliphila]MDM1715397.1 DUF3141 domain-containing protein [Thiopseudomonas alkaliphila]
MQNSNFIAKQQASFATAKAVNQHLSQLSNTQTQHFLSAQQQRQQQLLKPLKEHALKIPTLNDWGNYLGDLSQRWVLFLDTLRQRGDNTLAHAAAGYPVLLKFDYEVILDGLSFNRPVNYSLLKITPRAEDKIDPTLPPVIVIDPRGGHGAGIGGFKKDSEIGESLRAGHPTYFISFGHNPAPGQTLVDIANAQVQFIQQVMQLHPEADKPVLIGNCQAGWALMGLAATRPELPGVVIVNGAPLSYWAGENGSNNPMRYSGGLLGGAWMTRFGSDLGNGRFDGAWLVSNFAHLNLANTYWTKYYNLFSQIDTEPPRFLDFERWWGAPSLLNGEEIEAIVDELFIGNRLAGLNDGRGNLVDLRQIKAPIVVFSSYGDNITPPQQALNWIADLYPDDLALRASGQTIVYLKHDTIGHLGIFVSGKVARREHREMIGAIESIKALPPGLFELIIDDVENQKTQELSYKVHFEPRSIIDLRPTDCVKCDDEQEFIQVERVSSMTSNLYDWTLRPVIRQLINEPSAKLIRELHPFRLEQTFFSSLNPLMSWLPGMAQWAKQQRRPLNPDNPLLAWQNFYSTWIESSLDTVQEVINSTQEMAFHALYGALGALDDRSATQAALQQMSEEKGLSLMEQLEQQIDQGGALEATLRILLLFARAEGRINKERLEYLESSYRKLLADSPELPNRETIKAAMHQQNLIVFAYPEESLNALPKLLGDEKTRQTVLNIAREVEPVWQKDDGEFGKLWAKLYKVLNQPNLLFGQSLEAPKPTAPAPATAEKQPATKPASAATATYTATTGSKTTASQPAAKATPRTTRSRSTTRTARKPAPKATTPTAKPSSTTTESDN